MIVIDDQGTVRGVSDGAELMFGYVPDEMIGRPVTDFLGKYYPDYTQPSRSRRVTGEHRGGHTFSVAVIAHPFRMGTSSAPWIWALMRSREDMASATDGPSGAEEVSDALLKDWAFEQSPFVLGIHDPDLRFVSASEEMRRVMGLPDGTEVRGRRLSELLPDPLYAEVENRMQRVMRTGRPSRREVLRAMPGEETPRRWLVSLSPLKDAEGRVRGLCAAMEEITERYWTRKWLSMLSEAGRRVGASLDVTKTANALTEVIVPQFADLAIVDLLDPVFRGDEMVLPVPAAGPFLLRRAAHRATAAHSPFTVEPGQSQVYPEHSPPALCVARQEGVLSDDQVPEFAQWVKHSEHRPVDLGGIRSMIALPLSARGAILGVLICLRTRPERFTTRHLRVGEELATRAALALDNARRYTRERTTAVALQRSLLPRKPPNQSAVDVAARYLPYLPADSKIGVGGDWFDVIPLSGARVALVVGDVVGHGVRASAAMARLRGAVRTLAYIDLPPEELLTHLDNVVMQMSTEAGDETRESGWDEHGGDIGATFLYGVYDSISRRLVIARAGHPPPAVVHPDGTAEILDLPAGPPLGLGGLPYEAAEIELPESSTLALYTDGLIEAHSHDIDVGLAKLCESLAVPESSLEGQCDAVLRTMLTSPPRDDVVLLIARTCGLPADQVAVWEVPADPASVAEARAQALRQLEQWRLEDLAFTTELIVSELVTNAIRYGHPPIQLRLIKDRGTLICEVYDASGTAPHMRRAYQFDEGGRGLLLVAQLSSRWGSRYNLEGKTIWCEQITEAR
ncbi:SpoIIE family protein phosphatase [Streptomyces avermitilis]|uniref:SpoIIE family protein phosphatase n=1 Tax=Streptomyces avermitilis TaxID=33903 RepID=UPI0033A446BB